MDFDWSDGLSNNPIRMNLKKFINMAGFTAQINLDSFISIFIIFGKFFSLFIRA